MSQTKDNKLKFDGASNLRMIAPIESCAEFAVLDLHCTGADNSMFRMGRALLIVKPAARGVRRCANCA